MKPGERWTAEDGKTLEAVETSKGKVSCRLCFFYRHSLCHKLPSCTPQQDGDKFIHFVEVRE